MISTILHPKKASSYQLAANECMGKIEHGTLGPLQLYDIYDTFSKLIANDFAINVPRHDKDYLYPPDGPSL